MGKMTSLSRAQHSNGITSCLSLQKLALLGLKKKLGQCCSTDLSPKFSLNVLLLWEQKCHLQYALHQCLLLRLPHPNLLFCLPANNPESEDMKY